MVLCKQKMVLIIDDCQRVLEKDKESFAEDLKKLISTDSIKIILIPNKSTNYDFDLQGLQTTVKLMSIEALNAGDSAKVVHHYCKSLPQFIGKFASPQKLEEHPLMKEFKFTTPELEKICYLIE